MIQVHQNENYERYTQLALSVANEYYEEIFNSFQKFPERMTATAQGGVALVYKFSKRKHLRTLKYELYLEVDNDGEVVGALFKNKKCVTIKNLTISGVRALISSYDLIIEGL